jgi:hypothetical protein
MRSGFVVLLEVSVVVVGGDMVRAWAVDAERRDRVVKILKFMFVRCD